MFKCIELVGALLKAPFIAIYTSSVKLSPSGVFEILKTRGDVNNNY